MLKFFIVFLIIFSAPLLAILIRLKIQKKENPNLYSNESKSKPGISEVIHSNSSKKISESFQGAENMIRSTEMNDYTIENLYRSFNY